MINRLDQCTCLPVASWSLHDKPLTSWTTASQTQHVRLGGGLIDKDQASEVQTALRAKPAISLLFHVGAILLGRPDRFFCRSTQAC